MTVHAFDGSERHCKELYIVLQQVDPKIFDQSKQIEDILLSDGTKSGFKPLVLLPGRTMCCGKKVVIRYASSISRIRLLKYCLVIQAPYQKRNSITFKLL